MLQPKDGLTQISYKDPTVLKVFKQSFGDGPIDIDLHRVTIIATKP